MATEMRGDVDLLLAIERRHERYVQEMRRCQQQARCLRQPERLAWESRAGAFAEIAGDLRQILDVAAGAGPGVRACRVCGCTQERACVPAGAVSCYWVARDLCSACVGKEGR